MNKINSGGKDMARHEYERYGKDIVEGGIIATGGGATVNYTTNNIEVTLNVYVAGCNSDNEEQQEKLIDRVFSFLKSICEKKETTKEATTVRLQEQEGRELLANVFKLTEGQGGDNGKKH